MDRPGFLAEGFCLYGDNAYVNRAFVASPDPSRSGISVDDSYIFFTHSSISILNALLESLSTGGVFFEKRHRRIIRSRRRFQRSRAYAVCIIF